MGLRRPLLVLAVVAVLATGPVPVAGRTARAAQTGPAAVLAPAGYPALDWRFDGGSPITGTPLVVGDVLLVRSEDSTLEGFGKQGILYALDRGTGTVRWQVETGDWFYGGVSSHVTADGEAAYISDVWGKLRAIDLATGETRWRRQATTPEEGLGSPPLFPPATIVDGVVFIDDIVGNNGVVYALDAESGEELWAAETGPMESYQLPVVDGTVFVADVNGDLWLLDAATGELRAKYEAGGSLVAAPVVGAGVAFLVLGNGTIDAVDAERGERRWRTELPAIASTIVAVADGVVFVRSFEGLLFALDVRDGRTLWQVETFAEPLIGDGVVYVADGDDRLTAIDATSGDPVWDGVAGRSPVTIAGGILYASSSSEAAGSSLYALDAATGQELWRLRIGGKPPRAVAVTDGTVYAGGDDGYVYALTRRDRPAPPSGFAGSPIAPATTPLASQRLGPLPDTPAFAGIWRITVPGEASGTIPALSGPTAGYLESGSLDFPDGAFAASAPISNDPAAGLNPITTHRIDGVEQGETLLLPLKMPLAVTNPNGDPAELLVFGVLPEDELSETGGSGGISIDLVGGGEVRTLPNDGGIVDLSRQQLDAGAALVPTVAAWPDLIVVESGSLSVVNRDPDAASDPTRSGPFARRTITAGDAAVLPAGGLRFVQAGQEPTTILVLSLSGGVVAHSEGGGCGGRCIQTGT